MIERLIDVPGITRVYAIYSTKDRKKNLVHTHFTEKDEEEINAHWTHGPHPFDKSNRADIELLTLWKSKATETNMYSVAIDVWTRRDVLKQNVAKINNLNYITIY